MSVLLFLRIASDSANDARNALRFAFNAVKRHTDFGVSSRLLSQKQIQNGLEVTDGAHRRIDFVSNHSGHLIDDIASFQMSQSSPVFPSLFFHAALVLERLGKFPRTAAHQNLQQNAVKHHGQKHRPYGPKHSRMSGVQCLQTEISQITVGTGFEVLEQLIDIGMRHIRKPLKTNIRLLRHQGNGHVSGHLLRRP